MATNKCSYPNPADDVRSRVTYSAAAEIIYRLDTYLKNESRSSTGGSPPADIIRSVFQCAMAAVQVLAALDATWMDNKPMSQVWPIGSSGTAPVLTPEAAKIIERAMLVLTPMLGEVTFDASSTLMPVPKWRLMFILSNKFFLFLAASANVMLESDTGLAGDKFVEILQGCVDSAMGMVHELNEGNWETGHEVPARVLLAMRDHVIGWRLECAGPTAVLLMERVYEAVTQAIANEP